MKELSDHLELSREEIRQKERASDGSVNAGVPKIPPFDETKDEIDSFLRRFERYALSMKWDKSMWATHLSALLKGRALDVFSLMPVRQASNYDELKAALLRRYDMTEDGLKRKFRACRPEVGESFSQFSVRLASYLTRWIEIGKNI